MSQISVKSRLYILIGFFIFILLLLSLFTILTTNEVRKINHSQLMAQELNVQTLRLRKHEKDFLMRDIYNANFFEKGQSKYLEKFRKDFSVTLKYLDSLKADEYYIDAGVEKEVNNVKALYDSYSQLFFKLIEEQKKRGFKDIGLVGKMRESIDNLENSLVIIGENDKITIHMILLRRYEIDYNLYRINKFVDKWIFRSKLPP